MKRYELYLFDFDYTLADSSRGIVKCFTEVLAAAGFHDIVPARIKRTIGLTLEEAFSELTGEKDPAVLAEWRKQYVSFADTFMNNETFLFPEVKELFNCLRSQGALIGIISTKYRYRIEDFLLRHFEELPVDIIIGGEDVKEAKPSPEGINTAIIRLGVNPSDVLYCGDSTVDARSAENAGVDFAGVLHGVTPKADLLRFPNVAIVDNLLQLLPDGK